MSIASAACTVKRLTFCSRNGSPRSARAMAPCIAAGYRKSAAPGKKALYTDGGENYARPAHVAVLPAASLDSGVKVYYFTLDKRLYQE